MANTFTAAFGQTTKVSTAETTLVTAAVTTNPTNTVLLATAGANGAIVTSISAMPRATVTATSLLILTSGDSGSTKLLIDSVLMEAHTLANTTATPKTTFSDISETTPLRLEALERLYVGSKVALASGIVWKAEFTDL